ncbi:MAG: protease inhibitor I42 family protein [candidate division Zixibacteria bacterium]|nr:protease inhibitor I42 family protein [candidate division Zixibacteria bacterium]
MKRDLTIDNCDSVQVVLCSNPTTGLKWGKPQIGDSSIVALVERNYEPGDGANQHPPIPGSGGSEVMIIQALDSGRSTITMEYSQPWEGGQKVNWVFVLTITVEYAMHRQQQFRLSNIVEKPWFRRGATAFVRSMGQP